MGKIDDIEHAEDNRQTERQQRIKAAVNQPDRELAHEGLNGNAEYFGHELLLGRRRHMT